MLLLPAGMVLLAALAWATDLVTLQGERTVYTVRCERGTWVADRCTGVMVAGDRYRYRALKAHAEVIFWVAGSAEPSGKFTGCEIRDGRNWACKPNQDAARSVAVEMSRGRPVAQPGAGTKAFHAVPKFVWLMLDLGLWPGTTADSTAQRVTQRRVASNISTNIEI